MPPDIKLEHPANPANHEDLNASSSQQHPTPIAAPCRVCRACGAAGVKNRCGACRQVFFCGRECQKAVWAAHRPECQQAVASNAAGVSNVANNATDASNETNACNPASNRAEQLYVAAPPTAEGSPRVPSSPPASPCASPKDKKKAVVLVSEPIVLAVIPPAETPDVHPAEDKEEENDLPFSPSSSHTPSSKSKKKKNKKKKARSNSLHAPASAPMAKLKGRSQSLSAQKHVVWGEVRAREFTRFPGGGSAVPYDGSWALGLGSPVADVQLGSVLEVEELRLGELEARAKDLTKSQRAKVREGETRQFDYKSGARNPLFGRLSERERRRLFSESELRHLHELEEQVAHRKQSLSSEAPHSPTLSASEGPAVDEDFACVASEQLNEFAVIRDSRDDACGCSCGELLKKVTKMNVKKLHAFLSERHVKISGGHSKPELLAMAKAIALREQNCSNSADCECARNGVGCHANVCVGCAGDCHNPHSQYAYNKDQVLQYRKQMIAQWQQEQQQQQQQRESLTPISVA